MDDEKRNISDPKEWVKMFPTMQSFSNWVRICTIDTIESTLYEFEDAELYEYCAVILKVLNEKRGGDTKK